MAAAAPQQRASSGVIRGSRSSLARSLSAAVERFLARPLGFPAAVAGKQGRVRLDLAAGWVGVARAQDTVARVLLGFLDFAEQV